MINITTEAHTEMIKVLQDKGENPAIRIYIAGYGWGGPNLGLALDEPTENDESFQLDGFSVCVDKKLLSDMGGFKVNFKTNPWGGGGFTIRGAGDSGQSCESSCC